VAERFVGARVAPRFRLSVRRAVRTGEAEGSLIEDVGVSGQPYDMTERDVFRNNRDLIDRCGELLATQTWTHLRVLRRKRQLVVETVGLDRLDIFVDGHPSGPSIRLRGTAHTESRPRWGGHD
jgi:hypothetical protein